MARLTAAQRRSTPKSKFALPNGTKASKKPALPLTDPTHDRDALRMVGRSLKAGNITSSQAKTVRRDAKAALGKKAPAKKAAPRKSK